MRNHSRCAEVDARFPGLLRAILGAYAAPAGDALRTSPDPPP